MNDLPDPVGKAASSWLASALGLQGRKAQAHKAKGKRQRAKGKSPARQLPWLLLGLVLAASACGGGDEGGGGDSGVLRFEADRALGRGGILPDVAATAEGNLHLVYRGDPGRGDNGVYYQFYRSSGSTWSQPLRLDDEGHRLSRSLEFGTPRVAADRSGRALVVWGEFPDTGNNLWARDVGSDGTVAAGFQRVHSERSIAVEQHDVAIDATGAAHLVFGLIGQGQDGIFHKTWPAGGAWPDPGSRRLVFAGGRKHPAVEAHPSASGTPLLWAAWRYRDLEYISFSGGAWSGLRRVVAPQDLSLGDPSIAVRADGSPTIGTSPYQRGASNRSAYVHHGTPADPLLQIDIVTVSSSGITDVGVTASGKAIFVWDRFTVGARPDGSVISNARAIDIAKDKIVNKRRVCFKLSDAAGRFPAIPDEENSNAYILPLGDGVFGEQSWPAVEVHGETIDFVYQDSRDFPQLQMYHRRARLP